MKSFDLLHSLSALANAEIKFELMIEFGQVPNLGVVEQYGIKI